MARQILDEAMILMHEVHGKPFFEVPLSHARHDIVGEGVTLAVGALEYLAQGP